MGESLPTAFAPRRNRLGVATFVVAVLILVAVSGILGLDIWRTTQPDADGLAGMVQSSMNDFFRSDDTLRGYGLRAGSTSVMRAGENAFEGQVDVSTDGGTHRSIPVHVRYDGTSMFWETDPGAFLFVTQGSS